MGGQFFYIFKIDRVLVIVEGRIVVVCQILPAAVIDQTTVYGNQRVTVVDTSSIYSPGNLFFSGSAFPGDHHGKCALTDLIDGVLQISHSSGNAVETVEKTLLCIAKRVKADAVPSCIDWDLGGGDVEYGILLAHTVNDAAVDGKQCVIDIPKKLVAACGGDLRPFPP